MSILALVGGVTLLLSTLAKAGREVLLATPQARARYRAYLTTLARTHAGDPAMRAYVACSTAELAAREEAS